MLQPCSANFAEAEFSDVLTFWAHSLDSVIELFEQITKWGSSDFSLK